MPASPALPEPEIAFPTTPLNDSPLFNPQLDIPFDVHPSSWTPFIGEYDYSQYYGGRQPLLGFYNGSFIVSPASYLPPPQPQADLLDPSVYQDTICTHGEIPLELPDPLSQLCTQGNGVPYLLPAGDAPTADPLFYSPLSLPLPLARIPTPASGIDNGSDTDGYPTPTPINSVVLDTPAARTSTLDGRQKKIYDTLTQKGNMPADIKHAIIDGLLSVEWATNEPLPVDVCSKLMYVFKADPCATGRGSRVDLVHYVCLLCEWTSGVKGRADAWYHMNWHFDIKTKGCDLVHPQTKKPCTWRFHQNNDLWRHRQKVHGVPRPKVKKGGHATPTPDLLLSERPPLWHPVVASIVKADNTFSTTCVSPGNTSSIGTRTGPIIRAVPQPAAAVVESSSKTFAFQLCQGQDRRGRRRQRRESESDQEEQGSTWEEEDEREAPPTKRRRLAVVSPNRRRGRDLWMQLHRSVTSPCASMLTFSIIVIQPIQVDANIARRLRLLRLAPAQKGNKHGSMHSTKYFTYFVPVKFNSLGFSRISINPLSTDNGRHRRRHQTRLTIGPLQHFEYPYARLLIIFGRVLFSGRVLLATRDRKSVV